MDVILGSSLVVSSIGAGPQDCAGLQVLAVDAQVHDAALPVAGAGIDKRQN